MSLVQVRIYISVFHKQIPEVTDQGKDGDWNTWIPQESRIYATF